MNRRRGFTLVELGVVVLVLVLGATIAAPRLSAAVISSQIRQYRDDVFNLPIEARERAIQSGRTVTLAYSEGAFRLEQAPEDGSSEEATVLATVGDIGDVQASSFELNGSEVGDGEWLVNFYPDGTADPSAFALVDGGNSRAIRILSSGRLAKADGEPSEIPDPDEKWEAGDNGTL